MKLCLSYGSNSKMNSVRAQGGLGRAARELEALWLRRVKAPRLIHWSHCHANQAVTKEEGRNL